MDIMTGWNCRQLSLLTWNPCIGQFVHPERGEDINVVEGEMLIYSLIRDHENPNNNISIISSEATL